MEIVSDPGCVCKCMLYFYYIFIWSWLIKASFPSYQTGEGEDTWGQPLRPLLMLTHRGKRCLPSSTYFLHSWLPVMDTCDAVGELKIFWSFYFLFGALFGSRTQRQMTVASESLYKHHVQSISNILIQNVWTLQAHSGKPEFMFQLLEFVYRLRLMLVGL